MEIKDIKELIRLFDKSDLNKLKIKDKDFELSMQTGFEGNTVVSSAPAQVTAPAPTATPAPAPVASTPSEATPAAPTGDTINAPMVGTFYASPSPEASAFVKPGDTVKAGQTLCILEAMKIMNEVEAEFDCKIVKVLVDDASPVEYDMPIFEVEKI